MYSRRMKLNKKKPKPTKQKQVPGSNWGPRLALIERERALAGGPGTVDENGENVYDIHSELVENVKKQLVKQSHYHHPQQHPTGNNSSGGNSGKHSRNDVDPVLRLGRSTSPNYFYYNYSRRTAPNASGSSSSSSGGHQRKISCPEPSSTRNNLQGQSKLPTHVHAQVHHHQRRASYVLGSSSGYCSGSVTTLSTCANNNPENSGSFEQFSKPLTLIIPSQERYEYVHDRNKNIPKIGKSVDLRQDPTTTHFGMESRSPDSFPSPSSDDEGLVFEGVKNDKRHVAVTSAKGMPKRLFQNPMANMGNYNKSGGGILQISTKEIVQIHAPPPHSPTTIDETSTEPETLEMGADDYNDGAEQKSATSTGTSLAQSITMVYVPMETSVAPCPTVNNGDTSSTTDCESGEDYNENADVPELGQQSDDCGSSTGGSCNDGGSSGSGKEADDSLSSNFILKKKVAPQMHHVSDRLDSYDSILFKPRPGEGLNNIRESNVTFTHDLKGSRKRPEQPPPLPPSNSIGGKNGGKPLEKQKNLRFALENLETVLNIGKSSSAGDETPPLPPPAPKKLLKKVTLSLPGEDNISSRNHELLLNYEELNNCSSEILSCGHVRSDDYSTLSSLTSAQEISDFDEIGSNQGNNSTAGDVDAGSTNGVSCSSGGESDGGTGAGNNKPSSNNHNKTNKSIHEPRSVLQQLRDLSRLIRGSSPTKATKAKENSSHIHLTESNSFFLHQSAKGTNATDTDNKRKTSDATDNSADSGKGSGSGTSASGSSGQEGSSSSAEPSPNNTRGVNTAPNGCKANPTTKNPHSRQVNVATIRGRGGGAGSRSHYALCAEDTCQDDSCSQKSTCSCQDCCDYRSDCNECILYNKPNSGFAKPHSSEELCSNEGMGNVNVRTKSSTSTPKATRPASKIVRRTSSRVRAARRTSSLKKSKHLASGMSNRKPIILDYCDCSNCDLDEFDDEEELDEHRKKTGDGDCCNDRNCRPPPSHRNSEPILVPIKGSHNMKCKPKFKQVSSGEGRKISSSSASSGISSASSGKLSRISAFRTSSSAPGKQPQQSKLLRQSDAAATGAALNNPSTVVPLGPTSSSNLFTIDEANEDSVYESGAIVIGKGLRSSNSRQQQQPQPAPPPRADFQLHPPSDESLVDETILRMPKRIGNSRSQSQHSHPKCWLAPDATLGWSDLESLYSQNIKFDGKPPPVLRDECPTCWKELSEMKKNCPDPNRTVDRTKRMFIWLNRRHKEFHAPWWEAKKQASMRWLLTKAFANVPKDKVPDPFKESKKGKPAKYSLRDEIVKGLVSGKLYCMALDSLYRSQQNNYHLSQKLTHWEIIKILSRRGIYIAQPSDMKLTEATLRQKKPIRTAAHIALIEALMGLYAKEILGRDRIADTLRSFGKIIDPDTNSPERLVISWINTAVTTLKSYILSNAQQHLPTSKVNRWMNLPEVGEIRDLCDGVGICALFALYCSNDLKVEEISVPESGDTLTIYDSITNHSLVQKLCEDLFPEPIYHLCVTDFLYIHGCMKQNILCFLVDLFVHLEINPILRVNRLTHVPIHVEL